MSRARQCDVCGAYHAGMCDPDDVIAEREQRAAGERRCRCGNPMEAEMRECEECQRDAFDGDEEV